MISTRKGRLSERCTGSPRDADMYVTLEPCCHHGKQPPCTDAIIEAGIKRVIIGSSDPNPLVAGKGVEILRESGIEVVEGFLKEECDEINRVFFSLHNDGKTVCRDEIRDDDRREDSHVYGQLKMDNGGAGERTRTPRQEQVHCHNGRHRYGARGRSAPDVQDRRRQRSGEGHMRHGHEDTGGISDREDCRDSPDYHSGIAGRDDRKA